jgi:hypothetical protein
VHHFVIYIVDLKKCVAGVLLLAVLIIKSLCGTSVAASSHIYNGLRLPVPVPTVPPAALFCCCSNVACAADVRSGSGVVGVPLPITKLSSPLHAVFPPYMGRTVYAAAQHRIFIGSRSSDSAAVS